MRKFTAVIKPFALLVLLVGLGSCAYYNTFYNAEQYYEQAQQVTRENQSDIISREEINLYSKSIEKSKKLLQNYPKSKYQDDAQFLIAKAYYYKGDYLIAKRYFDDLALNYGSSPFVAEVPLWIGRCLLQVGDLPMAEHEASRILREKTSRALQADALLLMGEIAVRQDSLQLAERYLEQVIDRSPDGFTKAQAQFQVGRMRENKGDYETALAAYKAVSKYKPSESLKVESIIRQTSMLKALGRDTDAIKMIRNMLESDKFVYIRGQLEVELGKLYLSIGELDKAEAKFLAIIEDYARQDVAAEASFYLGELKLIEQFDYTSAKEAYSGIKTQSMRSPFVNQGAQRIKQVDRYTTLQFDFTNLSRQLAGLKPLEKSGKGKSSTKDRNTRASRSRGRGRAVPNEAESEAAPNSRKEQNAPTTADPLTVVSSDDSTRFLILMDENRYALAEYMLFEFSRVDTTLRLLDSLESASRDSSMKQQAAYMRYYALGSVRQDQQGAAAALTHILNNYPDFHRQITEIKSTRAVKVRDPREAELTAIAELFEKGDLTAAHDAYQILRMDSTASATLRARACFNTAWLNDHYLYDREAALEAYEYLVDNYSNDPLVETAQKRLKILKHLPSSNPQQERFESSEQSDESNESPAQEQKVVKDPKSGEKESRRRD
jgi:TolA-binding protein